MGLSRISIGPAVLFSFFLLSSLIIPLVFGSSSENWVEVLRFTGNGLSTENTETFVITYTDWRIRWSFESSVDPPPTTFMITLYNSKDEIIDSFVTAFQGNGTLNYNSTGSFYLSIRKNYVKEYEVKVEQNIESIPEFPLMTILISGFFVITLISIIYRKKESRRTNNEP
ncbi:MAG: hypothetical protein P8X97_08410 [Candidatus Bathyarchaeota archaeon]